MVRKNPAAAFHPSEYIQDELNARGWTLADMVSHMNVANPKQELSGWEFYMLGDKDIRMSIKDAEKLEHAFGVSAQTWRNLEDYYFEWIKESE